MFSRYFRSELAYLRELGKEFAERHPAFAGLFAERGGDPDVERLLEGFAFLTARIRERIDDAIPEVIGAVAEMVVPQANRTLPACSIVEFSPKANAGRSIHHIPQGSQLGARTVDGAVPLFQTTSAVVLLPIEIGEATLDEGRTRSPHIDIPIERFSGVKPETDSIRFFVNAPLAQSSTLLLWLMRHLSKVSLCFGSAENTEEQFVRAKLRHTGVDGTIHTFPWPDLAPSGLRLLQEYFTLPAKMCFFDIDGIFSDWSAELPNKGVLRFHFEAPPSLPERLATDTFRLNCAPVINLFSVDADPITQDERTHENLVRAAAFAPHHTEVYAVRSVAGIRRRDQRRRTYTPFYSFRHLESAQKEQAFYTLRRVRSPLDDAIDTYISVMTPRNVEPSTDEEVLSLDLTCTNRRLTEELRLGDINVPTSRSPTIASFRNLVPVSKPVRPTHGDERHWRTVSHLALNLGTLARVDSLRALLGHYNLHATTDHQLGRANDRRILGIKDIEMRSSRLVIAGVPLSGFLTKLTLDEAAFSSVGDAFFLGCALDSLFVTEAAINLFSELTVSLHPSEQEVAWAPRTGTQSLL